MTFVQMHAPAARGANLKKTARFLMAVLLLASGSCFLGCQSGKAAAQQEKTATLVTIHLEAFVVNLADNDGRSYLRVGVDLGVENETPKKEQPPATLAVIRDTVISLLSTLKSDDLLTPDGKKKLKQDLTKILNDRLPELKVREIYFNEFMVQR